MKAKKKRAINAGYCLFTGTGFLMVLVAQLDGGMNYRMDYHGGKNLKDHLIQPTGRSTVELVWLAKPSSQLSKTSGS